MKLIVMGAGYTGMALLNYLKSQPHEIFITTTKEERIEALRPYGKGVLLLNANQDKDLRELMNACDGMVILVAPKNSLNYEETYLNTAKRISLSLKERQKPFYILYTSSTSVYEGIHNRGATEDAELSPKSENAKILLETEDHYLRCGAQTCVLRLGGIYGPKRELIDRARRFSGKTMSGTGLEATNNIHLDDIVKAIAFCLDHSHKGVYNLVSDDHTMRKDLYNNLCKSIDIPAPIWNPDLPMSSKGGYIVSNQKIKETGFIFQHPSIQLRDGCIL